MWKFFAGLAVACSSMFSPAFVTAQERLPVAETEYFDRTILRKGQSIVLYSDGTFERRASFYPNSRDKHWSTITGTWQRTGDGGFCFKRRANYFHDRASTRTFSEGSCMWVYRSARGQLRMQMKHAGSGGLDGPVELRAANDGFHFPSAKALTASGARQVAPDQFIAAAQGKRFVVNQWLGRVTFKPHSRAVFSMGNISQTSADVVNWQKKKTQAVMQVKGASLCTNFTYKNLWADGCGKVFQDPQGRFYVVSDVSGYAYMGGALQ